MNRHVYFGADHHVGIDEGVEAFDDAAACGVFDRYYAQIGMAFADLFEDASDVCNCFILNALPEFEHRCRVAETSHWTEVCNA